MPTDVLDHYLLFFDLSQSVERKQNSIQAMS